MLKSVVECDGNLASLWGIRDAMVCGSGDHVLVRESGNALLRGGSSTAIDATRFGCRADYESISCAITATGQVTRLVEGRAGRFVPGDVGKLLIIDAARAWEVYSPDPTPLNARITAVDSQGIAQVEDIDGPTRGKIVPQSATKAEFFTENTDAIVAALAEQLRTSGSHVQLPAGVIGICPVASKTWQTNPLVDPSQQTRMVFILRDGAALAGHGSQKTKLKLGYFGEFEPFTAEGKGVYHCTPRLFLFEPKAGATTRARLEGFTVEFPRSPVVMSGYLLATDTWNTAPPRHAIKGLLRDIALIDPQRNTRVFDSSFGGLYDASNHVTSESIYRFENCNFETGGGCSIKNQNELPPEQSGGKRIYLTNVNFVGGGNIATRHYFDCAKLVRQGDETFLEVNTPGFSWHDFNALSDQTEGPFQPWCRVRKAHRGIVRSVQVLAHGQVELTLDAASPISKAGCTLLLNFGQGDRQVFIPEGATLESGNAVVKARLNTNATEQETAALVGASARIYYEENLVHGIRVGLTPRRIKLDAATTTNLTLLDQQQLDITVNTPDYVRGAFGHTFYVGNNVSFFINGMKIHDCAKRSFRVSSGGSNAATGQHELTDYEALAARGMAAMANNQTVFQAAEEFGGLLKLRRSKASSVYLVTLDMDDHSSYVAQGGIAGDSIIRNSHVTGTLGGGKTQIENSTVDLTLSRIENGNRVNSNVFDANVANLTLRDCRGTLSLQNGDVQAEGCELALHFYGDKTQYEQWRTALRGRFTDCKFTSYVTGLYDLSDDQRSDFGKRMPTIRSGVAPTAGASGRGITGMFTLGSGKYAEELVDRKELFALHVQNGCGVRPAHLFALGDEGRQALFIDSRYDRFQTSATRLDDVLFSAYQHGASSPDLLLAQSEFGGDCRLELEVTSPALELHASGKLRPASLRPRTRGEKIVLRWDRDKFCWLETDLSHSVTMLPTWRGLPGEVARLAKPQGNVRGWQCEIATEQSIVKLPGDGTLVELGKPIDLGFTSPTWRDANEFVQVSKDNGGTWHNAFASPREQAYGMGTEIEINAQAGRLRATGGQPLQVRFRTAGDFTWKPITE